MPRASDKWRFAIGTTSRVPEHTGWHYLMFDFDEPYFPNAVFDWLRNRKIAYVPQKTTHGWHIYTNKVSDSLINIIELASTFNVDPAWLRIGAKRGYLFLADKGPVLLPWPVERMVIARGKKIPRRVQVR